LKQSLILKAAIMALAINVGSAFSQDFLIVIHDSLDVIVLR
jgi:hypothetical protein